MKFQMLRSVLFTVLAITLALPAWSNPTVEDFLRAPELRDVEISPDGKHLAMIINEGDIRKVIVRNVETPDMPVVGGFAGDVIRPSFLYWGNNDRLLISLAVPWDIKRARRESTESDFDIDEYATVSRMISVDKDMDNAVILMEGERALRNNRSLSRVTNFLPNKSDNVLMAAYRDGKRTLYEVNIDTGEADLIARGSTRTYKFLNDDDGNLLYRFDYRRRAKAIDIYQFEEDGNWEKIEKIYLSKDDEDSIDTNGLIALYLDSIVYRKWNKETGFYELVLVDRETGEKSTLVSLEGQDVRGALFSTRADQIIGYRVEKDFQRDVFFDDESQRLYDEIAEQVGEYNFRVSGLTSENQKALVQVWGADNPYSIYLWDFEAKQLNFLDYAYSGLATDNLSLPAMATYEARDGTLLRAYLLLPKSYEKGKQYPTIVLPHGGPHARSRPDYSDFAQFLSTRGYIVVEPNFRGSVGYGRDFQMAGYRQWGGLMQDDLTDAVNFMVRAGYTDPEKVCIVGGSYGGYAALMGAIKTPDLFKCAISLNGVTHLVKQVEFDMKNIVDKDEWQKILFDRIGHPKVDKEMLNRNSPALSAGKITIPVMIVAGTDDETVPFSQAKLMVKALKKAEVEYEFIELEDTGHNPFYFREDMEVVFNAVEKFLATHLN